jgi:hypothetical protein
MQRACSEVEELHAFFEAWYRGTSGVGLQRVSKVLASEFELLAPNGELISRNDLLSQLASECGAYPELRITIHHVGVRPAGEGGVAIEYVERHTEGGAIDERRCCALLREGKVSPLNVEWVAIYEHRGA